MLYSLLSPEEPKGHPWNAKTAAATRPDTPPAHNPRLPPHAEGSAFIELGDTAVLCAVSLGERVPPS